MVSSSLFLCFLPYICLMTLFHVSAYRINLYHQEHPSLQKVIDTDPLHKGIHITTDRRAYLMKINVGTNPTMEALLIFDTGSTLIWVQSALCMNCYLPPNIQSPPYNLSSSELLLVTCERGEDCQKYPFSSCSRDLCRYNKRYADQSTSSGVMGIDTFTLDGGKKELLFGIALDVDCSKNNYGCAGGIAGFGLADTSFPLQFKAKKWAFSLPLNKDEIGSVLFDDQVVISGDDYKSTLLEGDDAHYVTNINKVCLDLTDNCKPVTYEGVLVYLDTGSEFTHLQGFIYDDLEYLIMYEIAEKYKGDPGPVSYSKHKKPLCYDRAYDMCLELSLGDEVSLETIDPSSLWQEQERADGRVYCLKFRRSEHHNIIGANIMRGHLIAFDLKNRKLPKMIVQKASPTCMKASIGG